MSDHEPVTGDLRYLDGGRLVFLGSRANLPGTWYVGFRSLTGEVLKFALSSEGLEALIDLAAAHPPSAPVRFPPDLARESSFVWRQVLREDIKDVLDELAGDDAEPGGGEEGPDGG